MRIPSRWNRGVRSRTLPKAIHGLRLLAIVPAAVVFWASVGGTETRSVVFVLSRAAEGAEGGEDFDFLIHHFTL